MLHIHFTDSDLAHTRVAKAPDPLWEIAFSMHRLQTDQGRWAFADWRRAVSGRVREQGLRPVLSTVLLPLFPRTSYFPDFLTPQLASEGLDAGLEAVMATPDQQVRHEIGLLDQVAGAPAWTRRLSERDTREALVQALRAYHRALIDPFSEQIQAHLEADRAVRLRDLLNGGVPGLLQGLAPLMQWRPPVLEVPYVAGRHHLHLDGRGLLLLPSYFCWGNPVSLADPSLPPVLAYPLKRRLLPDATADRDRTPLAVLLGSSRATVLRSAAQGATTGELARAAAISAPAASRHANALREAGLITTHRHGACVLHTLTPLGASLLRGAAAQ
ncbi:ArsR family transcriptional regulator [Streptacidiphilus cavernicola]|uniref:ArsR family transcriptional regulator n=1 Tax=Streptacidiphilus cavernicola TaxID=3342716 RepID=A0ABV6W5Q3_9ACTN